MGWEPETIEAQSERHRAARVDRAARRFVPPENEYQIAGLRLEAQAQGEDFAAKEHAPGTPFDSRPPVLHRGFAAAIVEASTAQLRTYPLRLIYAHSQLKATAD